MIKDVYQIDKIKVHGVKKYTGWISFDLVLQFKHPDDPSV